MESRNSEVGIDEEILWGKHYRQQKKQIRRTSMAPTSSPLNIQRMWERYQITKELLELEQLKLQMPPAKPVPKFLKLTKVGASQVDRAGFTKKQYIDYLATPHKYHVPKEPTLRGKAKTLKRKLKRREACSPRLVQIAKPTKVRVLNTWKDYRHLLSMDFITRLDELLRTDHTLDPKFARCCFKELDRKEKEKRRRHRKKLKKELRKQKAESEKWFKLQIQETAELIANFFEQEPLLTLNFKQMLLSSVILVELVNRGDIRMKPVRNSSNPYHQTIVDIVDQLAVWMDTIFRYVDVQYTESVEGLLEVTSGESMEGEEEGEEEEEDEESDEGEDGGADRYKLPPLPALPEMEPDLEPLPDDIYEGEGDDIQYSKTKVKFTSGKSGAKDSAESESDLKPLHDDIYEDEGAMFTHGESEAKDSSDTQYPTTQAMFTHGESEAKDSSDTQYPTTQTMLTDGEPESKGSSESVQVLIKISSRASKVATEEDVTEAEITAEEVTDEEVTEKEVTEEDVTEGGMVEGVPGGTSGDTSSGISGKTSGGISGKTSGGVSDGVSGGISGDTSGDTSGGLSTEIYGRDEIRALNTLTEEDTDITEDDVSDITSAIEKDELSEVQDIAEEGVPSMVSAWGIKLTGSVTNLPTLAGGEVAEIPAGGIELEETAVDMTGNLRIVMEEVPEAEVSQILITERISETVGEKISVGKEIAVGKEITEEQQKMGIRREEISTMIPGHKPSRVFEHAPNTICCLTLKVYATWLLEVANNAHAWSKWLNDIIGEIRRICSIIRGEVKDTQGRPVMYYKEDWVEFSEKVEKMIVSWRQYSMHVKDLTDKIAQKFEGKKVICCPKCMQDNLIVDVVAAHDISEQLAEAVNTATYWRRWLDDIVMETKRLTHATTTEIPSETSSYGTTELIDIHEVQGSISEESLYEIEEIGSWSNQNL